MTVQAMKAGAVDFLTKPVRAQTLLDAVTAAIDKDISQRATARLIQQHVDRYAKLTVVHEQHQSVGCGVRRRRVQSTTNGNRIAN